MYTFNKTITTREIEKFNTEFTAKDFEDRMNSFLISELSSDNKYRDFENFKEILFPKLEEEIFYLRFEVDEYESMKGIINWLLEEVFNKFYIEEN